METIIADDHKEIDPKRLNAYAILLEIYPGTNL
jgi:hypothetical protein